MSVDSTDSTILWECLIPPADCRQSKYEVEAKAIYQYTYTCIGYVLDMLSRTYPIQVNIAAIHKKLPTVLTTNSLFNANQFVHLEACVSKQLINFDLISTQSLFNPDFHIFITFFFCLKKKCTRSILIRTVHT